MCGRSGSENSLGQEYCELIGVEELEGCRTMILGASTRDLTRAGGDRSALSAWSSPSTSPPPQLLTSSSTPRVRSYS